MRRESGSKLCGRAFQPVDDVQLDLIVVAQSKTVARRAEEWTPLSTLWTDVTERFLAASHAKTQLGCKQPSENVCGSPVPCGLAVHRAHCCCCRGQSRLKLARRALSNPETTDQPPRCCRTREMCRCTSVTRVSRYGAGCALKLLLDVGEHFKSRTCCGESEETRVSRDVQDSREFRAPVLVL